MPCCRGRDGGKDQSYVLWGIRRQLLPRLLFPVGDHRKEEIRRIAGELGLAHVAAKPDSQEICFVADRDHARFVRQHRGPLDTSGEIVTTDGTVVGRHDGLERFTVGQRKGLGVAFGEPRYVVRIEAATRRVVLGTKEDLARHDLTAAEANWLVDPRLPAGNSLARSRSAIGAKPSRRLLSLWRRTVFMSASRRPVTRSPRDRRWSVIEEDRVLGGGWIE